MHAHIYDIVGSTVTTFFFVEVSVFVDYQCFKTSKCRRRRVRDTSSQSVTSSSQPLWRQEELPKNFYTIPAESDKKLFTQYVAGISSARRNSIADRIEKLVHHQSFSWRYFFGCITLSSVGVMAVFKLWGPRHIFRNIMCYARPLLPAIGMGLVLYVILFTCRGLLMRSRITILIHDYEDELRRIKAHHSEERVTQLAWLEFVIEQLKQHSEYRFDFRKIRDAPPIA